MDLNTLHVMTEKYEAIAYYFSGADCGVCTVLQPAMEQLFQETFPAIQWQEVALDESPEIAGQLQLFSIPTLLVYFDGKEVLRKSRNFSAGEIKNGIERLYSLRFDEK
ncbi:MAG: Thioredoxin [uncultured Thiotrichaceae bacterium]|uniref:Thioredoxin n=1 Tax=uncultured Thiotrichaceae bacterium TaxID=298394 RepID=A0A6S6SKK6_9GAMM|nr:MAG: Thioredoxin [uncultured Thiotrichaceae bacterium]